MKDWIWEVKKREINRDDDWDFGFMELHGYSTNDSDMEYRTVFIIK